ncbi:MAG: TldD/PmbA family protein [Candidatus Sericytochromatia bacterium]
MLNEILDIASKYVDAAEVYYLESHSTPVNFEVNRLKSMESKETRGVALRVIKGGRSGFASTTDLESTKFEQLVKFAIEIADFGAETNWTFPTHHIESNSLKMKASPDLDKLVSTGKNAIEAMLDKEPETLNNVSLNHVKSREIIMNSNGISAHREGEYVSFSLVSQLVKDNDILYIYEGMATTDSEINYNKVTSKILEMLKNSKAIFQVTSKNMPVLFTPKAMSSLLIPVEPALNGKAILQGSSYFTKKLGQKVMDERITIYEDPSQGLLPISFDDEGVPVSKKSYIENGILKQFYYDLQTAGEAKVKPTGNGFRGGLSDASPAISNLIFADGDKTLEEMIESVEEGIIVDQFLGAGQGNTLSGAFSLNIALGFLIEKGKIVGRIKDCMLSGNSFDSLNNIKYLEKNPDWLGSGNRKYPAVLFNGMNVVSKK